LHLQQALLISRQALSGGDPGDTDAYGAQQHGPLLGVELSPHRFAS
jgi:hypothetical protein